MEKFPIEIFVRQQCQAKSLTLKEIVLACGYTNVSKGLRRFDELFDGDFYRSRGLIAQLPAILDVPKEALDAALDATDKVIADQEEAAYRAVFVPHAIVETEKNGCPQRIFFAAVCNAPQYIIYDFPENVSPNDYLAYAIEQYHANLENIVRWFFPAQSIAVNYSPDYAVRYSLEGEFITVLEKAKRYGSLTMRLR